MKQFPLSLEDWASISEQIISLRTVFLVSYQNPLFFLNAGQPGCGKTELNNLTRKKVEDDLLECNADALRDFHPDAPEILRDHEHDYPDITWDAADRWNQALIEKGIEKRYNILIETTLSKLEQALATIERMKNNGYQTHIQILAMPSRWSWLGTKIRFESNKADKGFARMVSEDAHDDRFSKLQDHLPVVLSSPFLDQASLYTRKLTVSRDATSGLELVTDEKGKILPAFQALIYKKMDDLERKMFLADAELVVQLMQGRDAPTPDIESFQQRVRFITDNRE